MDAAADQPPGIGRTGMTLQSLANDKDVPRVAFLGFEFINTSLEATAPVKVERIRLLDDVMRQKLRASFGRRAD
jgi:hypothetical protein